MSFAEHIVPVVLSGGSGTRLWPLSRESCPKQFLALAGDKTLLQQTALRASDRTRFGRMLVIANHEHRFLVAEQLRAVGLSDATIIIEPVGRNTGPAAAVAALQACEHDADPLLLLMPADHNIREEAAFLSALDTAAEIAHEGRIVMFGITPDRPATGYGYIKPGEVLRSVGGCPVHHVAQFREKPDQLTAEDYVNSGEYLWNSGMFLVHTRLLISEFERYEPAIIEAAAAALAAGERDLDFLRLPHIEFSRAPQVGVDTAVMERTARAAVVAVSCGWSDLGAWSTMWEIGEQDQHQNVLVGDAMIENSRRCYVRGDNILAAAVGVEDLTIVATEDAVLVARRSSDGDVKTLVARLKEQGHAAATALRRVYRPWGFYECLNQGHRYQVKRITVNPGAMLSLQKHFHRAEHWVVVNGTALVTRDKDQLLLRENESIYLPLGSVHRLENPGKLQLNLIEVQSGAYLGEDDIVRFEDVYQRI